VGIPFQGVPEAGGDFFPSQEISQLRPQEGIEAVGVEPDPAEQALVFRQRNDSPHWKQISPLFTCFDSAFPVEYRDTDVEDGFCYRYVAVRLGPPGEFEYQYGPTAVLYPSGDPCP